MDLSLFMNPIHPLDRDYSETLREDQETVILADQLGFKDAFIGEHVTDAAENITNSALFLSSLASVTKRIRLSTGTSNLPQGHPALLAGQIAMLDHLCGGRFNFGISPGILASDSEALEIPHDERGAMFLECIDHIVPFAEDTPKDLIATLLPDVLIKGGDYQLDDIVGREEVEAAGGTVTTIPLVEGRSTTNIVEKIRKGSA